jgi:hypothetical protein
MLCHCFMLIQGSDKISSQTEFVTSLKLIKSKMSGNFLTRHSLIYETKLADGYGNFVT